jgi:hypothetical protein
MDDDVHQAGARFFEDLSYLEKKERSHDMKTMALNFKTLNWDYVWALILMIVILGSLTATVLTSDTALAQAVSDLVASSRPLG